MSSLITTLRFGQRYESLDNTDVLDPRNGDPLASISTVNAGVIRKDQRKISKATDALRTMSCAQLIEICAKAADVFVHDTLTIADFSQSPQQYVETLSITSGLPHMLCRSNMDKVRTVLAGMESILRGLTRGLDLSVIDTGIGEQAGVNVSYSPTTDVLGVVLPSNSPGVNSIWLPAIAMKTPVMIKPGREEPWTPLRIIAALIAAGCPREAFGFYPTDHEGTDAIMTGCGRAIIFGDDATLQRYADHPGISCHGTGRSKILIGEDMIDQWESFIDVLVDSVAGNSGRSCINASSIFVPRHGDAIAEALAARLSEMRPRSADDPEANLSAFANAKFAEYIDGAIEDGLATPGARAVTVEPRKVELEGYTYLLPTVIRCDSVEHPLANTEFLFPFTSVVEVPQNHMLEVIGPSLVVTAITHDETFRRALLDSPDIDRLNLGPLPTSHVQWDQPHEGNLFEFLYRRRAIAQVNE